MTFWYAYLFIVVPLVIMMAVAMWPPCWWQWAALLVGPLVTTLAVAEVPVIPSIGWLATIGVAYAFLLVPPVLPWRRRWGRWSIPATVLLICALLAAAARFEAAVLFYLGLPALFSIGALVVMVLTLLHRRNSASAPVPPTVGEQ